MTSHKISSKIGCDEQDRKRTHNVTTRCVWIFGSRTLHGQTFGQQSVLCGHTFCGGSQLCYCVTELFNNITVYYKYYFIYLTFFAYICMFITPGLKWFRKQYGARNTCVWYEMCTFDFYEFYWDVHKSKEKYNRAPVSTDSVSAVYRSSKKNLEN
jgi:hypothetical protein